MQTVSPVRFRLSGVSIEYKVCPECHQVIRYKNTGLDIVCPQCDKLNQRDELLNVSSIGYDPWPTPSPYLVPIKQRTPSARSESIKRKRYDNDDDEEYHENDQQKPKKRKARDPYMPKRHVNAYMYFTNHWWNKVEMKQSSSLGQNGAAIGAAWRDMPSYEKEPFDRLAAADLIRYKHEMSLYNAGKFVPYQ